jgi:hypothetical protein
MKSLTFQPERCAGPRRRTALKQFAKSALLAGGIMLACCNPPDWKAGLREWFPGLVKDSVYFARQDQLLLEREDAREFGMQRRMIACRLQTRHALALRVARAAYYPLSCGLTPDSAAAFVNALVAHGSVSQAAGAYDTFVINALGAYAGPLPRRPASDYYPPRLPHSLATEAVEQLIAITDLCAKDSVSVRLGKAALIIALENPALDTVTKWKIRIVLDGGRVVPLRLVEMPPCCQSANEPGQTPLDSLVRRMMSER